MAELQIKRHRVKVVAIGWFGTLVDEIEGMQETLSGLVGPLRGSLDLREMAEFWQAEMRRLMDGRYYEWPDNAKEALSIACRKYNVPDPDADDRDFQRWVQRWPMYPDHFWLGRLGRRYKCAILTQLDKTTLSNCLLSVARPIDHRITSDLAWAYKPSPRYFKPIRSQLRLHEPDELLVISAMPELDLIPAAAEGYQTAQIIRDEEEPESSNMKDLISCLN